MKSVIYGGVGPFHGKAKNSTLRKEVNCRTIFESYNPKRELNAIDVSSAWRENWLQQHSWLGEKRECSKGLSLDNY